MELKVKVFVDPEINIDHELYKEVYTERNSKVFLSSTVKPAISSHPRDMIKLAADCKFHDLVRFVQFLSVHILYVTVKKVIIYKCKK